MLANHAERGDQKRENNRFVDCDYNLIICDLRWIFFFLAMILQLLISKSHSFIVIQMVLMLKADSIAVFPYRCYFYYSMYGWAMLRYSEYMKILEKIEHTCARHIATYNTLSLARGT